MTKKTVTDAPVAGGLATDNEVRLVGRLSAAPEQRTLPSGDEIWTFRLVVPRTRPQGRQTVDVLECVAWSARTRRSVACWSEGDHAEVSGALRRRFYRAGGATQSRVEVEVDRARLIRRAVSA
ncbi:hypothetical protein GCM10009623_40060 [Nocardioides aestuarii]|uniref:Single-stranded DNA-binding protein n=1 Tax=Nocardioides aestuarii TaxID=252231 RepID=A0ABW4TQB3_9ACTN